MLDRPNPGHRLEPASIWAAQATEIVVGRVIDSEKNEYLNWLKNEFETDNPGTKVIYFPELGQEEPATQRFNNLVKNDRVDIFLGGSVFLHEKNKDKLEAIPHVESIKDRIPYYAPNKTWVAYYTKMLGVAWDSRCID